MPPTQVDVLAQIRAAFPPEPLRFEGALTGGLDGGAYREHVEGKAWEELDRKYVLSRSDVLSFRKNQARFEELIGALDPAQRAAIVAVLDVFAATESGQPADAAHAALERWTTT